MVDTPSTTVDIPARESADWPRLAAAPRDKWIVGVDLGQTMDPTAICVLHHHVTPLETWTPRPRRKSWKQDRVERFDVRHLERVPLGTPYPDVVQHVRNLLQRPPLDDLAPRLVIDETGVGRAVGDIFDAAGLSASRITITAGLEVTRHNGNSWHVPKGRLISALDARLSLGELVFAAKLSEAQALRDELQDFRRKVSDAGRATYSARVNAHDDLVLAVAMSVWWATNHPVEGSQYVRW